MRRKAISRQLFTKCGDIQQIPQALFFISENLNTNFLGGNGEGVIPDPIPNSEVKPLIADGTAHKSVEE